MIKVAHFDYTSFFKLLLALKWLVLILVRLSKLEDKLFSQEGEDDQNGPSPNSPNDSNARELILSKSNFQVSANDLS